MTLPTAGHAWTYHVSFLNGSPESAPDQQAGFFYQFLPYMEKQNIWNGLSSRLNGSAISSGSYWNRSTAAKQSRCGTTWVRGTTAGP